MRRSLIRSVGPGMALLALGLLASAVVHLGSGPGLAGKPYFPARTPTANKPQVVENYGKLPLSFEANQGQTDNRVDFLSRGSGYTLFLKAAGECAREVAPSGAAALSPGSRAAWAATFPVHRGDRPLIKPYSPGQAAADSLAGNPLSRTIEAPNIAVQ